MYTFTNEYCSKVDELSDVFRRELNLVESNVEDTDVDSDSDGDQQIDIHEVELTAMQHRRRVVRNVDGQVLTSYRELSNLRPARQGSVVYSIWLTLRGNWKQKEIVWNLITTQKKIQMKHK